MKETIKEEKKPEGATISIPIALTWSSAILCLFLVGIGVVLSYVFIPQKVYIDRNITVPVYMLNESFNCTKICKMPYSGTGCETCHVECYSDKLGGNCVYTYVGVSYVTAMCICRELPAERCAVHPCYSCEGSGLPIGNYNYTKEYVEKTFGCMFE